MILLKAKRAYGTLISFPEIYGDAPFLKLPSGQPHWLAFGKKLILYPCCYGASYSRVNLRNLYYFYLLSSGLDMDRS